MAKIISCPACGNRGDCSDDIHFEVRGKHNGMMVRKCMRCDQGLYIKAFGKPRVIQPAVWARMQEIWDAEFGEASDSATDEIAPDLDAAWDRLISSDVAPLKHGAAVVFLFNAAVGGMAQVTDVMAGEFEDWEDLSTDAYEGGLRIAIGPNLLFWLQDAENNAFITKHLDCRPSETVAKIWDIYLEYYVPAEYREEIAQIPGFFETDAARAFTKWARLMRAAAGIEGVDLEESLTWAARARGVVEMIDEHYWSMLKRIAEESA